MIKRSLGEESISRTQKSKFTETEKGEAGKAHAHIWDTDGNSRRKEITRKTRWVNNIKIQDGVVQIALVWTRIRTSAGL
jgi:hypothetical protein